MLRVAFTFVLSVAALLIAPTSAFAQSGPPGPFSQGQAAPGQPTQGQPLTGPPPQTQPAHEAEVRRDAERQIEGERGRIENEEWSGVKQQREVAWRQRGYVPPPSPFRLNDTVHSLALYGGGSVMASAGEVGTTLTGTLGLAPRFSLFADLRFASERLRGTPFLVAGGAFGVQVTYLARRGPRSAIALGIRADVPIERSPYSYAIAPELRHSTFGCIVALGSGCFGAMFESHVGVRIPVGGTDAVSRPVRPYFGLGIGPVFLF